MSSGAVVGWSITGVCLAFAFYFLAEAARLLRKGDLSSTEFGLLISKSSLSVQAKGAAALATAFALALLLGGALSAVEFGLVSGPPSDGGDGTSSGTGTTTSTSPTRTTEPSTTNSTPIPPVSPAPAGTLDPKTVLS